MEKRRPAYDLVAIKAAAGSVATGNDDHRVTRCDSTGFDRGGIVEVIDSIERKMFFKSMTSSGIIAFGRMSIMCRHEGWLSTSNSRQMS